MYGTPFFTRTLLLQTHYRTKLSHTNSKSFVPKYLGVVVKGLITHSNIFWVPCSTFFIARQNVSYTDLTFNA